MRGLRFISLAVLMALASHANAQDVSREDHAKFQSDEAVTNEATRPDWYRRFTLSELHYDKEIPILRTKPEREIDLQWAPNSRLRLNFSLQRQADESPLRDEMRAGASFDVTPRFSLGGSVSLGGEDLQDAVRGSDKDIDAGIRLESAFKF